MALLFNNPLQTFLLVGIVYIIINFSIAQAAAALERRYAYLRY